MLDCFLVRVLSSGCTIFRKSVRLEVNSQIAVKFQWRGDEEVAMFYETAQPHVNYERTLPSTGLWNLEVACNM
jgi:hypothetical protein